MKIMYEIRDHPVIENLCRTGYPDGKEPEEIRCPVCGADSEYFYRLKDWTIVGCERCLTAVPYWEVEV